MYIATPGHSTAFVESSCCGKSLTSIASFIYKMGCSSSKPEDDRDSAGTGLGGAIGDAAEEVRDSVCLVSYRNSSSINIYEVTFTKQQYMCRQYSYKVPGATFEVF